MASLTKAQRAFLKLISTGPGVADPTYRPAMKLVKLGYATRTRKRGRLMFLWVFNITPAGRQALKEPTNTTEETK